MIYKENTPLSDMMDHTIDKIKSIAESNTVIGTPFESKDGTLIFPLTKVSLGFVTGGGEYGSDSKNFKDSNAFPFAGGTGAGVTMQPVGLLKLSGDDCKLIYVDEKSPIEKFISTIPDIVTNVTSILKKEPKDE